MELISVTEQTDTDFIYLTLSIVLERLAVLIIRDDSAFEKPAQRTIPLFFLKDKAKK